MTVQGPTQGTIAPEAAAPAVLSSIETAKRDGKRRSRSSKKAPTSAKHLRDDKVAYLMLAPMVVLLGVFVIWPLIYAFYLSGYSISFYKPPEFVGLDYYKYVLTNPDFWDALWIGLKFALMVVPAGIVIALSLALFLKSLSSRLSSVMKVVVYVPAVVSTVVASVLFTFIYQDDGLGNWLLSLVKLPQLTWLNDPSVALPAIAVPTIWLGLGLSTLILLSALNDIPSSYYEAARIDGASFFQQLRFITLPSLKNVLLYLIVTGFVLSFQQFEIPLVMTGGDPAGATNTPNLYIFNSFRENTPFATSYSITAALLLFIVIGLISMVIFKLVKSEKAQD